MFLRERISQYSSEVSGADREDRSQNALRTYASVCGTLELENRWTIPRIRDPRFSGKPSKISILRP